MQNKTIPNKVLDLKSVYENFKTPKNLNIDDKRMVNFSNKWFQAKYPEKAKKFASKLKTAEISQIFANNSLILTLLCVVLEEVGEVSCNRSHLYREVLDTLLNKWDGNRNIERDRLYKKLSTQRKEDLLSQIALKTFEQGDYFFKQKKVEQYVADYIRNLPDAQTTPEVLQLDSEAVLESIEAQHGLLVKRAKGIYSFCDPTFHEYFTAREIINSPDPQALERALQNLVSHVTETRWREVFLLAVGMLRNADYLLSLIKHETDALVASDQELQCLLAGINKKSSSGKAAYKPAAFRAFYIEFFLDLNSDFARHLDNGLAGDLNFNPASVCIHTHELQNCQFSEQQKEALKQYYKANKLLMDCLNNAHYVSRTVREELEETLFVPSEIS